MPCMSRRHARRPSVRVVGQREAVSARELCMRPKNTGGTHSGAVCQVSRPGSCTLRPAPMTVRAG